MYDTLAQLQAAVTKTSTFSGPAFSLPSGSPVRSLMARVLYSAATNASGSNSATFTIEHSDDNSNWYTLASAAYEVVNLTTTAQSGEIFLPIRTNRLYVRLVCTIAGAGSTPTIAYSGEIGLARP